MRVNWRAPILICLLMGIAGCSTTTPQGYATCVAGWTVLGGAAGSAGSGGGAVIGGAAVGAGVSLLVCQPPAEPEPVVMAVADSDGDGVDDDRDRCPDTPPSVEVDASGCPLDSDRDGVPDYLDRCPNTPAGVEVDERGCAVPNEVILTVDRLNFAFDSAELDSAAKRALDAAVPLIKANSTAQLDVVGHTDTSGPEAYNQILSERRAQAAVDYLVSQGVNASQLRARGMGESSPAVSNDTRSGREQNRRVELVVR